VLFAESRLIKVNQGQGMCFFCDGISWFPRRLPIQTPNPLGPFTWRGESRSKREKTAPPLRFALHPEFVPIRASRFASANSLIGHLSRGGLGKPIRVFHHSSSPSRFTIHVSRFTFPICAICVHLWLKISAPLLPCVFALKSFPIRVFRGQKNGLFAKLA
jgi:hypothetical protein